MQLQAFLKGWAQQHLPGKLVQLRALAQQGQQQEEQQGLQEQPQEQQHEQPQQQQQEQQPTAGAAEPEGTAPAAATQAAQPSGAAANSSAGDAAAGASGGNAGRATSAGAPLQAPFPAAAVYTAQEAARAVGAGRLLPGGSALPGAGPKRRRVSPRDPRVASATAAGAAGAAICEAEVVDPTGGDEQPEPGAEAGSAAAPVHGPAPGTALRSPTSLASLQLPPLSSFAGDSGRPLKRRMLSRLQPLLEAAGASDQHLSGWSSTGARRGKSLARPFGLDHGSYR